MEKFTTDQVAFLESMVLQLAAENIAQRVFMKSLLAANSLVKPAPEIWSAELDREFSARPSVDQKKMARDILLKLLGPG